MPDEVRVTTKPCGYPANHSPHNWRIPKQGSPGEMTVFTCEGGNLLDG